MSNQTLDYLNELLKTATPYGAYALGVLTAAMGGEPTPDQMDQAVECDDEAQLRAYLRSLEIP